MFEDDPSRATASRHSPAPLSFSGARGTAKGAVIVTNVNIWAPGKPSSHSTARAIASISHLSPALAS